MSAELLAIGCQLALSVFGVWQALRWFHRKEAHYLDLFQRKEQEYLALIPKLKEDFSAIVDEKLDTVINGISEDIGTLLTEPTVKKAFSILGKSGGDAKAESGLVDQMAVDILDSPQFAGMKAAAGLLGLDVDGYIEEHGAVKTIAAAKQLGNMLGIDIMNFDISKLGSLVKGTSAGSSGTHPYLGR